MNRLKSQIDRFKTVCGACNDGLPDEIKLEIQNQLSLFINQYNTLTRLETRYGEGLFQACQIEIDELLQLCANCITTYTQEDSSELINRVRENSVRLNLLQQRITGKIVKIKPGQ